MDAGALSVEQLSALSRAVPDDSERRDLELYLQGSHPKHRGVSDPDRLGTVERYFLEIKDIPRLAQRIRCLIFSRTYASTAGLVRGMGVGLECLRMGLAVAWRVTARHDGGQARRHRGRPNREPFLETKRFTKEPYIFSYPRLPCTIFLFIRPSASNHPSFPSKPPTHHHSARTIWASCRAPAPSSRPAQA